MDNKDQEFQKRILATFRIEAEEHLRAISAKLIELEKIPSGEKTPEIIEVMFREVHSLKGAARSVNQKEIEYLCQPLESIFSLLKHGEITLTPLSFDLFYKAVEWLTKYVVSIGEKQSDRLLKPQQELILRLKELANVKSSNYGFQEISAEVTEQVHPVFNKSIQEIKTETWIPMADSYTQVEMVRIPLSKLDPLLLQAEEMIQSKIAVDQRTDELKLLCNELTEWKSESQRWRNRRTNATTVTWNEWYDTSLMYLNKVDSQLREITRSVERDQHSLDLLVNNHLEVMKQVLMLPVSSLIESFPIMVREISHEQNKEIKFIIRGADLEIDKRILEEIKDPLIHLIRNSIDHGIGTPKERISQNKKSHGTIILSFVARKSGLIEISLSDDGKGIIKEQVLEAAIKAKNISEETAGKLDTQEILSLIYHSGISTSPIITDISGHGLGLSIVREKVEKLNGKISYETEENKGTTFHIVIPTTLTTFRGILILLNEFMFILPAMNVERVIKVDQAKIKTVENHETIMIDDKILSLVYLGEVLELPEYKHVNSGKLVSESSYPRQICLLILVSGGYRLAFKVDDLVEEQQVLVKGLGKLLNRVKNISGATVLGSGKVVPVLNVPDLMKSAVLIRANARKVPEGELFVRKTTKVLVAEDSITSRTLIKNILETAGYQVTTAIDGTDAYTKMRLSNFDIVVSDVDMPKMNGFELTAKIRGDKKLSEIPVVLVTALESREDIEHGIEVGADAYIIKSSFDQGNLLEVIKKLI